MSRLISWRVVNPVNWRRFKRFMDYKIITEELVGLLGLSVPPIAISFCEKIPDSVPRFEGNYPEANNRESVLQEL